MKSMVKSMQLFLFLSVLLFASCFNRSVLAADSVTAKQPIDCSQCASLADQADSKTPNLAYNWYFAVSAIQAVYERRGDDHYLILKQVDPEVNAFTDRPKRLAEKFSIRELVNLWPKIFLNTLPKSSLSGYRATADQQLQPMYLYVQLSTPRVIDESTLEFVIFPAKAGNFDQLASDTIIHNAVLDITENYQSIVG